jgi:hypothetical protein
MSNLNSLSRGASMGDVTFSSGAIVLVTGIAGVLAAAIRYVFSLSIRAKDDQYSAVIAAKDAQYAAVLAVKDAQFASVMRDRDAYRTLGNQAVQAIESTVNVERNKQGKPPFDQVAPVVPEHHSPVTQEQQDAADFATTRARLTAATLNLGMPVLEAPPPVAGGPVSVHEAPAPAEPVAEGGVVGVHEAPAPAEPAVISEEENSPVRQEEQDAPDLITMQARLTAARLELSLLELRSLLGTERIARSGPTEGDGE